MPRSRAVPGDRPKRSEAMALIVFRLLTNTRGIRFADLGRELGLGERALRNYRQAVFALPELLGQAFAVEEVVDERGTVVGAQLRGGATQHWRDIAATLGALSVSRALMSCFGPGALTTEFERWFSGLRNDFRERGAPQQVLAALDNKVVYVPRAPRKSKAGAEVVEELLPALLERRCVRVTYRHANGREERLILEPYTLLLYEDGVYLVGKPRGKADPRTFALERMMELERLTTLFQEPRGFKVKDYLGGAFGIFRSPKAQPRDVELVFAPNRLLHEYLTSRSWHLTQHFTKLPDGRLRMRLRVDSLEELARWVRSFGDEVEVVAPPGDWARRPFGS